MADATHIEWADATANVINGCTRVSPGCGQGGQGGCYAERLAATRLRNHPSRAGLAEMTTSGPRWTGRVSFHEPALLQALQWKRPRKIFWNAHGDMFHSSVPDEWIDRCFAVCALTPQHTHMILTKRSARMREYLNGFTCDGARRFNVADAAGRLMEDGDKAHATVAANCDWPLPNVWLGVSVEDQTRADERIPDLLATPAAVRFISAEPLLGPVDLEVAWNGENGLDSECWGDCAWCEKGFPALHNCQKGRQSGAVWEKGRSGLDWVIAGGESGPGARPMHPDWARSLRDQCAAAGVPFHFKQWGEWGLANPQPSETPGKYAMMAREPIGWSHAHAVMLDHYPRQFTSFGSVVLERFGKSRAGRLLDGRTHDEFPA